MTLTFIYGRGSGDSKTGCFGGMDAQLEETHQEATLREIADYLAKKIKITDGEIELISLTFTYWKKSEDKKED